MCARQPTNPALGIYPADTLMCSRRTHTKALMNEGLQTGNHPHAHQQQNKQVNCARSTQWNYIRQLEKYTQIDMPQDRVESRKSDPEDYGLWYSTYKMYKNK